MKKWLRRFALGSLAGLVLFTGITFGRLQLAKVQIDQEKETISIFTCLLYTSPSPRDGLLSRMPSSA